MPIGEPYIHIECDRCEEVSEPYELTALAQKAWDARNVRVHAERDGWRITGDETICPECVHLETNDE